MLMQILSAYVVNRVINSIHNAGSLRSHNSESLHASYVRHCKSVLWARLLEINIRKTKQILQLSLQRITVWCRLINLTVIKHK